MVETPITHRFYGYRLFRRLKSPIYAKYNRDILLHFLSGDAKAAQQNPSTVAQSYGESWLIIYVYCEWKLYSICFTILFFLIYLFNYLFMMELN